ncbi:MAG: sigma 54-interacting transcriptional regulator [Deltaproteobacteria bacterium]|nr:sigma 54-interacting transcriptional regulator [Deltaproteobacteria bacterium]
MRDREQGESTLLLEEAVFESELKWSLLVFSGDSAQVVRLEPDKPIVVGRSAPAEVVVTDTTLSRAHARFRLEGDEVWVEDLGSRNGTSVGGRRVERARLEVGDDAMLGVVRVSVHLAGRPRSEPSGSWTHDRFMSSLADEIVRAEDLRREVALVILRDPSPGGVERWVTRLRPSLRRIDRVARYSASELEILLPETSRVGATTFAESISRNAAADVRCAIATFPESGRTADEVLAAARSAFDGRAEGARVRAAGAESLAEPEAPVIVSPVTQELFRAVDRVSNAALPVLIIGETGSGKEVVARRIHEGGSREKAPFRAVNCAAIPGTLLESTLFGHEKGAFTGATARGVGVFESAGAGTVFLDEVAELSPAAQAALLRVLEARKIVRVGGTEEHAVEARVVAATHRDLESMADAGAFRADLFYRLNAITISVPPLRERPEDIPALATRFSRAASARNDCPPKVLAADTLERLIRYAWPGNVRELRNVVERAVVISEGLVIQPTDLPERVRGSALMVGSSATPERTSANDQLMRRSFRDAVDDYEAAILVDALADAGGSRAETSRRLQVPLRTLTNKINTYRLESHDTARRGELSEWLRTVEADLRAATGSTLADLAFGERIEALEKLLIGTALEAADGNKAEAARRLDMPIKTLSNKAHAFGLRTRVASKV